MKCGLGKFKPECLQCFANINVAFIAINVAAFLYTFGWGIFVTGLSSIQRRYGLPSWIIGLNAALFETTTMIVVVIVTYLGGGPNSHRPRWIGFGIVFAAFGTLLVACVHFMFDAYDYGQIDTTTQNVSNPFGLCIVGDNSSASSCKASEEQESDYKLSATVLLLVGDSIIGAGFSPILTLGTAYIDDGLPKKKAPLYFGILYAMYPFGLVIGFPFSSLFLSYYVDIDKMSSDEVPITPDDPRWVGAWWMGYLVDGIFVLLSAIPFFLLPKKFRKESTVDKDTEKKTQEDAGTAILDRIKEFPSATRRLLINVTFMTVSIGHAIEAAVVSGTTTFLTKYMEEQFRVTTTLAANLTGICMVAASTIGVLVGGVYLRRMKPSLVNHGKIMVISGVITFILPITLFFLGCEPERFAGVTEPYPGSTSSEWSLEDSCNADCQCSNAAYDPICGVDDVTYFSPCHASCAESINSGNFTSCSCISNVAMPTNGSEALSGMCGEQCNTLMILFVVIAFIYSFSSGVPFTCDVIIALRSVDEDDKPFALGIRQMITQLLGWIPTPLYMGAIIDSVCILWSEDECGVTGACWLYDLKDYRLKVIGFTVGMKFLSLLLFTATWITLKVDAKKKSQELKYKEAEAVKESQETQDDGIDTGTCTGNNDKVPGDASIESWEMATSL
ncbi:solute carrier organic anion transporter family member 5A1-like, partial [Glandiceps talaboti]